MDIFGDINNLLFLLTIIPGLWVAGKFMPLIRAGLLPAQEDSPLTNRLAMAVAWLTLGGLFAVPFTNLLSVATALIPFLPQGEFTNSWGQAPWWTFSLFLALLMLMVYLLVWWGGKTILEEGRLSILQSQPLTGLQRTFLLLLAGSLVYSAVNKVVVQFIWVRIPFLETVNRGIWGFIACLLAALLLLLMILAILYSRLSEDNIVDEDQE